MSTNGDAMKNTEPTLTLQSFRPSMQFTDSTALQRSGKPGGRGGLPCKAGAIDERRTVLLLPSVVVFVQLQIVVFAISGYGFLQMIALWYPTINAQAVARSFA